jgi:hypothetical protein
VSGTRTFELYVADITFKRLLEPIGNIPPVEFETACFEKENSQAMAA